jgi:hypothetical protein
VKRNGQPAADIASVGRPQQGRQAMHYRDANRPEYAGDPRPVERDLGPEGTGNAAVDGYSTVARVPRMPRGMTRYREEMVPVARAERIEGMFDEFPPMSPDEY